MSLQYLPSVKPSAIAVGTVFCQSAELVLLQPIFGEAYRRAKESHSAEEFARSKQATSAAVAWGTTFVGSGLQSYGVGALLNATATLSYKGAAYLGTLVFLATSAPQYLAEILTEKRPWDTVVASVAAKLVETVGLATFLTWWGTRTNPFQ
ncbi:DUF1761 domain containing protein [Niveomyces insectorum RCEF 264]|uniref:DUF1761 domain containing protein n=1 Tax=Niveomyces insectorum RCEF 264 TaxID=1081102 RepID=A0A167ZBE7_9HYPO|nr:DUF1761 domain containing protein [Niveomyces insectorum RCEF 264]